MSEQVSFEQLTNTRDLGGIQTKDGRSIRYGMLFRSGHLSQGSEKDIEYLQSRLCRVVDFRTAMERKEQPDPDMTGVENIHLPILSNMAQGITREKSTDEMSMQQIMAGMMNNPSAAKEYMKGMYVNFVTNEFPISQYRKFVELLIQTAREAQNDEETQAVQEAQNDEETQSIQEIKNDEGATTQNATLWHCTAGKDRAGFGTVIVQEILGVSREAIFSDYLLTNEYQKEEVEKIIAGMREKMGLSEQEEAIQYFFGAKEEYLQSIYNKIDEMYGSFDEFLTKALGVTSEKRIIVQNYYLM